MYEVADDGALVSAGAPVPARADIVSVAVHPSGRFAYGVGEGEVISSYAINRETGLLTFVADLATGNSAPGPLLIHPSGQFAYQEAANGIAIYGIDDSGALEVRTPLAIGTEPTGAAVHSNGMFIFVACFDRTIRSYSIDGTGALTPVGSTTVSRPGAAIAVAPSRGLLLVAIGTGISVHTISATGELGPADFVSADSALSVAVDPHERFAYAKISLGSTAGLAPFAFNAAGRLEPRAPTEILGGLDGAIAVNPSARFVHSVEQVKESVTSYEIDQDTGELTELVPAFATGDDPLGITLARIAP